MDFDFTTYFNEYEALRTTTDAVFKKVCGAYPEEVNCRPGCDDCCYAIFDLTFIEALYINHQFNRQLSDDQKAVILDKANQIDRQLYRIKRKAAKQAEEGESEETIIDGMGRVRMRCPLLNKANRCDLYEVRPVICRLYGIPLAIGGKGRTCGISDFQPGVSYPTVSLDKLTHAMYGLSARMVREMQSRHRRMGEILVPLSMALLTDYDETYLGIGPEKEPEPVPRRKKAGAR